MYNQNKQCLKSLGYYSPNTHVWYTHMRGCIIKNWVDPETNLIKQERMPYNQPNHYLKEINDYFKCHLN